MVGDQQRVYTLHFTEDLIRASTWAYWRRAVGWPYVVCVAFLFGLLIYEVALGDRSWYIGVLASIVVLGGALSVAVYVVQFRGSIRRFRHMKSPDGILGIGEDRFRVTSDLGSSEMPWGTITEIRRFADFWQLFLTPAQYLTLPLADLDAEARELILERARVHGVKVV